MGKLEKLSLQELFSYQFIKYFLSNAELVLFNYFDMYATPYFKAYFVSHLSFIVFIVTLLFVVSSSFLYSYDNFTTMMLTN
jgi:hypothetical protein